MLLLNIVRPNFSGVHSWVSYLLLLAFWFSVVMSGIRFAIRHGNQFVQWPRLVPPPDYETIEADMGGVTEKGTSHPPDIGVPPSKVEL